MLVNEVTIDLGSTAYLQSDPGGEMTVSIVDGQADVSAQGTTITIPAGARARVPLDANGLADGPPVGPEPYDIALLISLPIDLLTEAIIITPFPVGDDDPSNRGPGLPITGTWTSSGVLRRIGDTYEEQCDFYIHDFLTYAEVRLGQVYLGSTGPFTSTESGVHVYEYEEGYITYSFILHVIAPDLMEYEVSTTSHDPDPVYNYGYDGCVFQLDLASADE
jgi:hypothetical protein